MIFYSKKQRGNCLGKSPFLVCFFLLLPMLSACVTMGDTKQEENLKTAVEDLRLSSANTLQAIEDIKTENEKLKGEIEKLNFLIKQSEEASSVRFLAIESKLSSASAPVAKAETVKEPEDVLSADVDKRYKSAREFHEAKNFEEAEKYYNSIIGSPSKWYEERALYYTGVLNYDKKDYEKAVLSLQEFVDKYPKSKNIPSALYFQGESLSMLGKSEEAKLFFDDLISRFPKSKEAKDAKKRLSK